MAMNRGRPLEVFNMNLNYTLDDYFITINSNEIKLPATVNHVFPYGNLVIVTVDFNWDLQNVFCFDESGKQVWRIEKPGFFTAGTQGYDGVAIDSGTDARYYVKGRVLAFNRGRPFELDIYTGRVTTIPGNFER
ncbi:MAG: hypothetical protein ACKOX6_12745 [Bdellovibrio sp.]